MSEAEALVEVRLLGMPLRIRNQFLRHGEGLLRELSLIRIGAGQHRDAPLPGRLLEVAAELASSYLPFKAAPAPAIEAALAAGADSCDVTYTVPVSTGPSVQRLVELLEEADGFCRREEHLLTMPAPREVVAYRSWVFGEFLRQLGGQPPRPWAPPATGAAELPTGAGSEERLQAAAPDQRGRTGGGEAGDGEAGGGEATGAGPGEGTEPGGAEPNGAEPGWGEVAEQPLVVQSSAGSVALSRRYVRQVLRAMGATRLEESAELGVSELVTNAVLHARTTIVLTVRAAPSGRVRIEVSDSSTLPVQFRPLGAGATTGRGLRLVAAIAYDWGVEQLPAADGPGKTVWFEPHEAAPESAGEVAGEARGGVGDQIGSGLGEWDLEDLL